MEGQDPTVYDSGGGQPIKAMAGRVPEAKDPIARSDAEDPTND